MKIKSMKLFLMMFLMFSVTCVSWGDNANYSSEIESKTHNLRDVQKTLKEKRVEKERCLLEERVIRRELIRIEKELNRLQKVSERLRREIVVAERKLKSAEKAMRTAENEKMQWASLLNREMNLWYRSHCTYEHLFREPVAEKLRFQSLAQKRTYFSDASAREMNFRGIMEQWKAAQEHLLQLKDKQDKTTQDQAGVKKQKKAFLKTTTGRRIVAEEDIKKLLESARALQQLIIKLERERKKSETGTPEQKRLKTAVKKHEFPWPMHGQVVTRFGKNKHAELDTFVISNGIKIQGTSSSEAHAIDDGDVVFSGEFRSYGLMVIVDHGGGIYSIYGQLGKIAVQEDQKIKAGSLIGTLPAEEKSLLYFEIRSDGQPEDPLQWLK